MREKMQQLPGTCFVIFLCTAVFFVIQVNPFGLSQSGAAVLMGAYYRPFVLAGEYWRLITVGFVHTAPWHLLMNMMVLWNLGGLLERIYGTKRFLLLLFLSVLAGSLFMNALGETVLAVGISGGLYGLMAAMLVRFYFAGLLRSPQLRSSILRTLGVNLLINFMPGVGYTAHLGGFLFGLCFAYGLERFQRYHILGAAAAVIFLLAFAAPLIFHSYILDGQYQGFDLRLLYFLQQNGMRGHAEKLAGHLDVLYDNDYLTAALQRMGG